MKGRGLGNEFVSCGSGEECLSSGGEWLRSDLDIERALTLSTLDSEDVGSDGTASAGAFATSPGVEVITLLLGWA